MSNSDASSDTAAFDTINDLYDREVEARPKRKAWASSVSDSIYEKWKDEHDETRMEKINVDVTDIAWRAWSNGQSALFELSSAEVFEAALGKLPGSEESDAKEDADRIVTFGLIFLQTARFGFDHKRVGDGIKAIGMALPKGFDLGSFPILTALTYFAAFGSARASSDRSGDSQILGLPTPLAVREFWKTNQKDLKIGHMLLHGLWLIPLQLLAADEYKEYRNVMSTIAHELVENDPEDAVAHYRLSYALRANNEYGSALDHMDETLRIVGPTNATAFESYLQQRNILAYEKQHRDQLASDVDLMIGQKIALAQQSFAEQLKQLSEDAQGRIDGSLFKVIEILGVFVALIAVVVTAIGAIRLDGLDTWARILMIVVALVLPLFYLFSLRVIVLGWNRAFGRTNQKLAVNDSLPLGG